MYFVSQQAKEQSRNIHNVVTLTLLKTDSIRNEASLGSEESHYLVSNYYCAVGVSMNKHNTLYFTDNCLHVK